MQVKIIQKEDFVVHGWSGGTTAEIFWFPPSSHWEKKDFEIRISSADCRIDGAPYSDFTGFTRHIMPLKGTMHMVHEGHHEAMLQTYDVDIFEGAWKTHHTGIAIDFNLLHTDRWNGLMKPLAVDETLTVPSASMVGFLAIIDTEVIVKDDRYGVGAGDFILFQDVSEATSFQFQATGHEPCVVAVAATLKE